MGDCYKAYSGGYWSLDYSSHEVTAISKPYYLLYIHTIITLTNFFNSNLSNGLQGISITSPYKQTRQYSVLLLMDMYIYIREYILMCIHIYTYA